MLWLGISPLAAPRGDVPDLDQRVRSELAERWDMTPERISITWGDAVTPRRTEPIPFRLTGQGNDGWMALVLEPETARAAAVSIRAGFSDSVMVATRSLPAGTSLAADDMKLQLRLHWGTPQHAPLAAPGMMLRHAVHENEALTGTVLSAPAVITAGQPVTVQWQRGGVTISMGGTALRAGALGTAIPVRVPGRMGRVMGTAQQGGIVTLSGTRP
jgi:flagella basal body P-ring formation protein FlgA